MKKSLKDTSFLFDNYSGPPILVADDGTSYVSNIEDPRNHWLYYAFRGFEVLKKRNISLEHFVTIATGPGIDAIGAMEILKPDRITVTDLVPAAIARAKENITRYQIRSKKIPVSYLIGNLCEPLGDDKADVIYANIPNIPIQPEKRSKLMDGITAATFFDPNTVKDIPQQLNRYLLALQYTFLLQAKRNLRTGGRAVINLGVRVPINMVKELFNRAGYEYEVLFFGFKVQTEPLDTIPGYARHEKDEVSFSYYPYGKTIIKLTQEKSTQNLNELIAVLKPLRVSANKALQLVRRGEKVGHIVAVLSAKPKTYDLQ